MAKRVKAGELNEKAIIQIFKEPESSDNPADFVVGKTDEMPPNESAEEIPEPEETVIGKDVPAGEPEDKTKMPENAAVVPTESAPREESRRRKSRGQDYESLFIRNIPITTRSGKTVYIRKEFHDRIMRIVQVISFNEVSLFSYIDNVLEHHFNTYQDEISELYKKRTPDIF